MGRRRRQRAASDQRRECAPETPQPAVTSPSTEVASVAPQADLGWITTAVQRLRSFFGGGHVRRSSEVAPAPAHGEVGGKGARTGRTGYGEVGGKGARMGRTGNQAWMHLRRKKDTVSSPPAPPQAPPQAQAQRQHRVVNGEEVPFEVEDQYIDYCGQSSSISEKTICHICFIQEQDFAQNTRVKGSELLLHCHRKHSEFPLVPCKAEDCRIYVTTARDLQLHNYFCHTLPAGWWVE